MSLPYAEGTWFAVPLETGSYAAGLVARATKKGRVILCYFFGRYQNIPALNDVSCLKIDSAILAVRVGDLALIDSTWPIIGSISSWNREQWPMPLFVRREEPLSKRAWLVHRSDIDPNLVVHEELLREPPADNLRSDSIFSSRSAQKVLNKLLD